MCDLQNFARPAPPLNQSEIRIGADFPVEHVQGPRGSERALPAPAEEAAVAAARGAVAGTAARAAEQTEASRGGQRRVRTADADADLSSGKTMLALSPDRHMLDWRLIMPAITSSRLDQGAQIGLSFAICFISILKRERERKMLLQ